jgi:hypothetical protein
MSSEELLLNENNKNGSDNPKKEELAKLANTSVWWVNYKVGKMGVSQALEINMTK